MRLQEVRSIDFLMETRTFRAGPREAQGDSKEALGSKRLQEAPIGSKRLQEAPGGSKRLQVASRGPRRLEKASSVFK